MFPQPSLTFHAANDKIKWFFLLGYKDIAISQAAATQIGQTLAYLQDGHVQHLRQLLDIYSNPNAIIDRNQVIIRHFPNARFNFSQLIQLNLYILEFPRDYRQDWFIGLTQAQDVVFALREGKATTCGQLATFYLEHGIQFYTRACPTPT